MTVSSEQQPSSHEIKVLSDQGSGRTFITIVDDEAYLPFATAVVEKLASKARSVLQLVLVLQLELVEIQLLEQPISIAYELFKMIQKPKQLS